MINVFLNHGSGLIADASLTNAEANIVCFVADCKVDGIAIDRLPEIDERGRFGFRLTRNGVQHDVEMPGLPLEQVRYMDSPGQNIWHFPRLYVDGSSWIWKYGLLDTVEEWQPELED